MAAECPLAERRIVEIKMGKSKFPGKPSKIGNRKRVNLSSCALPEENESSKAAENIYLGLSMFNEAFGDNEMIPLGPFLGFSQEEVQDALAEARLQQRESEMEYKKQGIGINLQDSFQNELAAIIGCFSLNGNHDKNKTRLCFDGGGSNRIEKSTKKLETSHPKPSSTNKVTSNVNDSNNDKVNDLLHKKNGTSKSKIVCKTIRSDNTIRNIFKITRKQGSFKSLQSRAAKKLLQKAKMSNITELGKSNSSERKFVLPSYSMHSLRVIKPNKKFIQDIDNRNERLLRARLRRNTPAIATDKIVGREHKSLSGIPFKTELRFETVDENRRKSLRNVADSDRKLITGKESNDNWKNGTSLDSSKSNVHYSSSGKLILREPKLQLNRINLGLTEGPFSASLHSSSLSHNPSSQLNLNPLQLSTINRTITCGVCGSVKFYKIVELAKKFGIYCCELCQKFISNIILSVESEKICKLQCLKGKGLCLVPSVIKSQHSGKNGIECQACWLKLCLKKLKMSNRIKSKLSELLPVNMQVVTDLYSSPVMNKDDTNSFAIGKSAVRDFKWLNHNVDKYNSGKITRKNKSVDKIYEKKEYAHSNESSAREFPFGQGVGSAILETKKTLRHKGRVKLFSDATNRQRIDLKGPRVKNVCRSASIVLGQPIATFPRESSPRKQVNDSQIETDKNCDRLEGTNGSCAESQGVFIVDKNKEVAVSDKKQLNSEKKSNFGSKNVISPKLSPDQQQQQQNSGIGRTKRKPNLKTENPISIDFWETYDPEEINETGFGLIGSENFSVRALCFLCGSSGQEKLIHCASCCEPYHEFCVNEEQGKIQDEIWKYDWVCPRCTVCVTCGKTSGQQLKCVKCDNSYHAECVDGVGGRFLHSPDRPWVCSVCLRCKSCNGVDVSVFVGNLPLCRPCFILRQKGNYCPLCQRCYEDDDYDSKMMECGQCKCWVHAKCEGLSDEKYQVLSFLPESVEYICRMCCVMPPAPWWIAIEAELKSGYLGVLKALSKNRKACAMLKWSPRKQCTCRQVNFTSKQLDFDDIKPNKTATESCQNKSETSKKSDVESADEKSKPSPVLERKTSIEVINHATEGSLKLTLKIMKGTDGTEDGDSEGGEKTGKIKDNCEKLNVKQCSVRFKKCPLNEDDLHANSLDCQEDSRDKNVDFAVSNMEIPDKRSPSSPLNPSSDSGIGSTDDELKTNSLTDEESCRLDDQHSNRYSDSKLSEPSASFFEDKNECICFLEVDSYNSRSKPFSPSLLSIKKKVTTSEYSSLQQFHMDMQRMIATTQSTELMEMYHQTVKEIFPWFDPKFSRVHSNSQKIADVVSVESTPVKSTPTKSIATEDCKVPKKKLTGQPLEYYYSGYTADDKRSCLMCKGIGDGPPNDTGRLLYCGQNEWVHCNCALWSAEVFEEIDGSLQNVHSAISRGRSIRCPVCNMKGASIGCCARNCAETFHFACARRAGCAFMDDKTVYCAAHLNETKGKIAQNEKEFEIRRPVYVELDKRKMRSVDSSQVRFAVGGLSIENLGRFVIKLSDQPDAIIPDQFQCTKLFWSCYEPWKIVRYHFSVRVQEDEQLEGVDFGINLTVDHSKAPEILEMKLKQLKYFQEHHKLLEIDEPVMVERTKEKRKIGAPKADEETKSKSDIQIPAKRSKKDNKGGRKAVDLFDPREDESCLSDSQNTADLIPPELEEAIFKDLPNDILDGISMQDIFMDIKSDIYENGEKEVRDVDDTLEVEEVITAEHKPKKVDINGDGNSHNEIWSSSDDSRQNAFEWTDEISSKSNRDLKRSRSDVLPTRRNLTLKSNQRSCSLNWNCKMDIHTTKWKRNSKCHTALLDPQERGNRLQELKFSDGLVMVSTESLTSVRDLKDRLAIQQEEGKENKCLAWHVKLQPRLLQVDGGVDSSSSGSEAGESPQRLIEESMVSTRSMPPPQPSPFSSNTSYPEINAQSQSDYTYLSTTFSLPQVDGLDDSSSDDSDFEYSKTVKLRTSQCDVKNLQITQLDGSADLEHERKINHYDKSNISSESNSIKEEPVKCSQCRCTYRTKLSYERHLANCSNDFILFSSDGEVSEEDSPLHANPDENGEVIVPVTGSESKALPKDQDSQKPSKTKAEKTKVESVTPKDQTPIRKDKVKRHQVRKKHPTAKKPHLITNSQSMQQILVQQNAVPQTVILQDISQPNIVPGALIDAGGTIQYVASLESQSAFTKPQLIATPSPILPGGFHIQTPDSQLISGLSVLPQNVQPNLPGIIIHQPQVAGTLISPHPTSLVMPGDQMMLGAAPLLEVIHDPQTGGMFLASHNQPLFYNMETIVSNTVMQTNQYVSNVMTASSFSQTSTQVVQTSKLEQIMNVPSNFVLVGQNSTSDKIISTGDLICLPASQPLMQNQSPVQTVVNPILQPSQALSTEPKIIVNPINQNMRCIQPVQTKPSLTPIRAKTPSNHQIRIPDVTPRVTHTYSRNVHSKPKGNNFRSMPMMRPNVTKSPPSQYEKAVIVPKWQKTGPRAIVDYINNFKSENCDIPTANAEKITKNNEVLVLSPEAVPVTSAKKEFDVIPEPSSGINLPITPRIMSTEVKQEGVKKSESTSPQEPVLHDLPPELMEVDVKIEPTEEEKEIKPEECSTEKIIEMKEEKTVSKEDAKDHDPSQEICQRLMEKSEELVEEPGREESSTTEVLPLQETSPTGNNTTNVPPKTGENDKLKEKNKLFSSNQNCVATKLVTIHPRLIQNPEFGTETENRKKFTFNGKSEDKGPKLIFDVTSDDGFKSSSTSMAELWAKICDSVQEMRAVLKIPPLPISRKGHEILGMQNHGLQHCLEQLRGVEHCVKYKCKYFIKERKTDDRMTPLKENITGCARTETYCDRKEYDMFAWLASRHRRLPNLSETSEEILSSARRANSLPMAMRYRHLRETAKTYVGVYRSKIHGKGLFCLREIEAGEMVIEYAGEVIRSNITDKREKYYTNKGIGCYMFRIDDHFVVDATMKGNAARFINHSCEPNCYSRVVDILGKKHIVIFALRRIHVMEELTYDYKFPFEDEKISCHCLSKKCRKYLN